jgi:mono/diheme cytochrome c family protein
MLELWFPGCRTVAVRNAFVICLLAIVGLCSLSFADTEDRQVGAKWVAPASRAQKPNPVVADSTSIAVGRKIYMQKCAKCHGDSGKGDGPDALELKLHPAKFTGSAVRDESDGALYWKISVGKGGMPDFGKRLSPNDRWHLVNFLRTFGGG